MVYPKSHIGSWDTSEPAVRFLRLLLHALQTFWYRPETWDHVALSDARDSVRHVRATIGHDVPLMGVGFSFGGFLLTALAGSVPREEHGFCGIVSACNTTGVYRRIAGGGDGLGNRGRVSQIKSNLVRKSFGPSQSAISCERCFK